MRTIESITDAAPFDTILYVDVLEHIADDAAELARARRLLTPEGNLVVLAPAHQSLFSPFDAAVGHYRRYDERTATILGDGADHPAQELVHAPAPEFGEPGTIPCPAGASRRISGGRGFSVFAKQPFLRAHSMSIR